MLEQGKVSPPEPIVSGLLFRKSMAIVGAPYDSFKTNWALQLTISLAEGIPCYSYSCIGSNVVYLVLEGGEDYILERLEEKIAAMGVDRDKVLGKVYIKDFSQMQLDNGKTAGELREALLALTPKPDVVILDPITYALNEDVRFSPQKAKLCRNLLGIAASLNGVVIPVVHCRKGSQDNDNMDDFLGTSIVVAAAATRIKLFRDGDRLNMYAKTRYADRPDKISLIWKHPLLEVLPDILRPREESKHAILESLKASHNQEMGLSDLVSAVSQKTKHNSKTVRAAINNLGIEGKIKTERLPKSAIKMVKLIPEEAAAGETIYAS